jgi:hypothetical protein
LAEVRRKSEARSRSVARPAKADAGAQTVELRRKNWIFLGAGAACILFGFILLSARSLTLAPILLLAGYLVLVPWGLVAHPRTTTSGTATKSFPDEASKQ